MTNFISVGKLDEFTDGSMKTVVVMGKSVALARIGEDFFAVSDICSHEQCSLGTEGYLDGETITCGCHGAQFDVTNGKVLALPASVNLETFEVKIENGEVMVGI